MRSICPGGFNASTIFTVCVDEFSEVIRQAIRECGLSQREIARVTGIAQPIISRFMSGERTLRMDTASVLIHYLDLELAAKKEK
jgi:ribosome-binding protein aMBF1 (putative translation factor)